MKVTETTEAVFNPIEIKLTIETKEELFEMWHRLNLSFADVKKDSDYPEVLNFTGSSTHYFWHVLNKCVLDRGYNLGMANRTGSGAI